MYSFLYVEILLLNMKTSELLYLDINSPCPLYRRITGLFRWLRTKSDFTRFQVSIKKKPLSVGQWITYFKVKTDRLYSFCAEKILTSLSNVSKVT